MVIGKISGIIDIWIRGCMEDIYDHMDILIYE